ncbi:hypothetical protein HDU86_001867 [Geranomyces michiganensis]|nr:hypothetical protein HDU86_001867 [Geranomyces michiganensis]
MQHVDVTDKRRHCGDNSHTELVACTRNRTFTVYFACRQPTSALNQCLKPYTTEAERDKLREVHLAKKKEWLKAGKPEVVVPLEGATKPGAVPRAPRPFTPEAAEMNKRHG